MALTAPISWRPTIRIAVTLAAATGLWNCGEDAITLQASHPKIPANGTSYTTLVVEITDDSMSAPTGAEVLWTTTEGTFPKQEEDDPPATSVVTAVSGGRSAVQLFAPVEVGKAKVTASYATVNGSTLVASTEIQFVTASGTQNNNANSQGEGAEGAAEGTEGAPPAQ